MGVFHYPSPGWEMPFSLAGANTTYRYPNFELSAFAPCIKHALLNHNHKETAKVLDEVIAW